MNNFLVTNPPEPEYSPITDDEYFELICNLSNLEHHLIVRYVLNDEQYIYVFEGTFQEQSEHLVTLPDLEWDAWTYYTALEQREAFRRKILTGHSCEDDVIYEHSLLD